MIEDNVKFNVAYAYGEINDKSVGCTPGLGDLPMCMDSMDLIQLDMTYKWQIICTFRYLFQQTHESEFFYSEARLIVYLGISTVMFMMSKEHEQIVSAWVKDKEDIQHRRKQ